jgi:hypothetical protein
LNPPHTPSRRNVRRACDLLRTAQHQTIEAAAVLGIGPEDGSLWTAVRTLVEVRERHERTLADR